MKKFIFLCVAMVAAINMQAHEEQTLSANKVISIERSEDKDFYYLQTGQQTTRMEKEAYLRFIENNCHEAWASYQKGTKLWKAGWGLLGTGLGILTCGCVLYGIGIDKLYYDNETAMLYDGAVFILMGEGMLIGSVPCLVVGSIKRNNTHEVYNKTRHLTSPLTFQLQTSQNGIGIAMNF